MIVHWELLYDGTPLWVTATCLGLVEGIGKGDASLDVKFDIPPQKDFQGNVCSDNMPPSLLEKCETEGSSFLTFIQGLHERHVITVHYQKGTAVVATHKLPVDPKRGPRTPFDPILTPGELAPTPVPPASLECSIADVRILVPGGRWTWWEFMIDGVWTVALDKGSTTALFRTELNVSNNIEAVDSFSGQFLTSDGLIHRLLY